LTILEKPLTFEDFKSVKNNANYREANILIKTLNNHIRRGEARIPRWSSSPTKVEILSIVAKEFKRAGWGGVEQKRNKINENYYSIELILPDPEDPAED
jgi:hypothetical protein